jgi:hypothetical protein
MLTIRNAQMRAFQEARQKDFADRLEAYLRTSITSGWGVSKSPPIAGQVQSGMEAAKPFGFERETEIAAYVITVCKYLGGFPVDHPRPALHILYGPGVPPEVRLQRFEKWCLSQKT